MIRPTSLLVKPAGPDCNIACRYCFYSGKKELFASMPRHRMPEETMEKAIREFLPLAGPTAHIGFQGGEPTLRGLDFFRQVAAWRKKYRAPTQEVQFSLQTNGLLLDEAWVQFLREENFLVGLSVDGPAACHDRYRRGFDDSPTHARVARTMALLKEAGVEFNTLTVVTAGNVDQPRELFDYFTTQGSGYMQFIPCVEVVDGKIADYTPTPQALGEFWIALFDLWMGEGQPTTYIRLFDELFVSLMEFTSPGCPQRPRCAANLVVEHNGDVYPCDFFVEPGWLLGNLRETGLAAICENPLLETFAARKLQTDPDCAACRWRSLCWGDCPKYWLDAEGRPARKSYWCESYRMLLEHAYPRLKALQAAFLAGGHPRSAYWQRLYASLGRNDACPCGSGLKLKKCCGPLKLP